jgi:hypothetical protein
MDLMRQLLVDASHTSVNHVMKELVHGLSKAAALAQLQEIINAASYYDEQMAELVSAAWELIVSGQLWDQTFESIYELEQIMSFDTAIKPLLQRRTKDQTAKLAVIKHITRRWDKPPSQLLPAEIHPKTWSLSLLRSLRNLADRVKDGEEAVRLIRQQITERQKVEPRGTGSGITIRDIQNIIESFFQATRRGIREASPPELEEQSEDQREEDPEMKGNGHTSGQTRGGFSFGERRHRVISTQGAKGVEGDKDTEGGENRENMETLTDSESQVQDASAAGPAATLRVSALRTRAAAGRAGDNTATSRGMSTQVSVRSKVKATSKCKECDPRCWVFLGTVPTKRIAHEEGMKLLERTAEVHWANFCHRHIRLLAANCAGLYNNEGGKKHVLIRRMGFVLKHRHHLAKVTRQKSTWFRKPERKLGMADRLGPYMWQPSEPEPFDFDAEDIFNRYAGSDDAWAQFQKDGTINIDGFFSYILGPEVFENISEEFDMYKYHLREKQGGKKQMGWMRHMFYSLTQQLVRQDPAYWAIMAAARPDRNWKLISYPYYTKDTTPGEITGFKHFDINVEKFCQSERGINQTQGSLTLDDEDEKNSTLLVKGFWSIIKIWWAEVTRRMAAKNREMPSGHTTNAKHFYTHADEQRFGKLTAVPCKRGAIRITRPDMLHGSTPQADRRRRTVFVWHCGIREDHETLDLEEAERWSELVQCHQGLITPKKSTSGEGFRYGCPPFTFPGVTKLVSTSKVGDAMVGARRWDDPRVLEERNILLGPDAEAAWRRVVEIRARLVEEFLKAWPFVKMAEMRAYGEHSFYRNLGKERPPPHGDDEDTANSVLSSLSSEE